MRSYTRAQYQSAANRPEAGVDTEDFWSKLDEKDPWSTSAKTFLSHNYCKIAALLLIAAQAVLLVVLLWHQSHVTVIMPASFYTRVTHPGQPPSNNSRPTIAVLSVPGASGKGSYIPASYVKWVESGGARVVPIMFDVPKHEMKEILESVNGLLYTGGMETLRPETPYFQAASYLYNLSIHFNNHGRYFPIWGTCMGHQLLALLTSGNQTVLDRASDGNAFDSENLPQKTTFTSEAKHSRLFGPHVSQELKRVFQTQPVAMMWHQDGVTPKKFFEDKTLPHFYRVLAVDPDRKNKLSISVFEGIRYPFYGVQFHPERNQFEWDTEEDGSKIHTPNAISAAQYLGEFFVNEARRNQHQFSSLEEENSHLIYRFPVTSGKDSSTDFYVQTYWFPNN